MPGPMLAVGDIVEVKAFTSARDQLGLIVRHFRVLGINGAGQTLDLQAPIWETQLSTRLIPCLSANARFEGVTVRKVAPLPASLAFPSTALAQAGGAAGDVLPRVTAGLVKLTSGLAGRKNRGRMYVPFPSEAHNDATGSPSAGYQALLDTLATFYTSNRAVNSGGGDGYQYQGVVYSRRTRTAVDLINWNVRTHWGRQLRRSDTGRSNVIVVG